jgi:hypothetical protein
MTWRHPSPNMTSDGVWVASPPCHPRVYRNAEGAWTFYCPAHDEARTPRESHGVALRQARHHASLRA